jgi:hypothetical protein
MLGLKLNYFDNYDIMIMKLLNIQKFNNSIKGYNQDLKNEAKRSKTKRKEIQKRKKIKGKETKRNKAKRNETKKNYVFQTLFSG